MTRRPNRWQATRDGFDAQARASEARARTLELQRHQRPAPTWSLGLLPVLRGMAVVAGGAFAWPYVARASRWLAVVVML